tara:strand:- start:541 stop:645 length:105 start_codon:yes stop_codon:yes gene_type:complete
MAALYHSTSDVCTGQTMRCELRFRDKRRVRKFAL